MLTSTAQVIRAHVTREKLTQVQARLEAAIGSFVSMPLGNGPNEREAALGEAAALLEGVYAHWQREKQPAGQLESDLLAAALWKVQMLPLLRGVHAQASQLQRLNDTALGFCQGWLSAAPLPLDDYTPEGIWASVREPSGLRIRA
jgi:hypothetical protein